MYNSEALVAAALMSALSQTCRNIEVIVVDDCSTDRSLAIIEKLASSDSRLRLYQLPINRGPAAARNRGFEVARGRWIAVLDADDLIAPTRIADLVDVA